MKEVRLKFFLDPGNISFLSCWYGILKTENYVHMSIFESGGAAHCYDENFSRIWADLRQLKLGHYPWVHAKKQQDVTSVSPLEPALFRASTLVFYWYVQILWNLFSFNLDSTLDWVRFFYLLTSGYGCHMGRWEGTVPALRG